MQLRPAVAALGLCALVGGAFVLGSSVARAGDEKGDGGMRPVAKVTAPFFKELAGSFTTASKASWGDGKGKVSCHLAVGETAFIEEYQNGEGEQAFHGMALYKVSDDGKAVTLWWIDSMAKEPQKFEGALAEDGYEAKGTSAHGPTALALKKSGEGFQFTLTVGDAVQMTETWTRVK